MIRQNKDGRPIYYDKIWSQMIETGKKLKKLGYRESSMKANLFVKPIETQIIQMDKKSKNIKGAIFADIRGTLFVPIWEDPRPLIYSMDLPFKIFLPELILLERSGCNPRVSYNEVCEPDGWMFGLGRIPSGFCKRCGEDNLFKVDWEILNKDFLELYDQGIDQNLEVNYCDTCRKIEYDMRKYRLEHSYDFTLCELCGIKDYQIKHHITYKPEKIIKVCRSCHGKIHHKEFPNSLWKERRVKKKKANIS
jgi:hypothetical protein